MVAPLTPENFSGGMNEIGKRYNGLFYCRTGLIDYGGLFYSCCNPMVIKALVKFLFVQEANAFTKP